MIYISKSQLDQVEYLIQQSMQGNHVLFDPKEVRKAFESFVAEPFQESDAYAVEHHIERMISLDTLAQKRAYLERLDTETRKNIVRTYFNIVENNLFENSNTRH